MDFFVSTSRSEGMPNAMLEAMASAVIPIVTRVGGVSEAVSEGENGFFLDPDDMAANIQKLESIFADCVKSPSKFNNIASSARRRVVSEFSPDVIVPQYEEMFLRLAESRESLE
jgi:glycosyltransferase involved in cell wall biosynthesis